jgi:threonine/homoserine/homoserine lactone efflux protein
MDKSASIFNHMSQVEGSLSLGWIFEWVFWAVLLGLFLGLVINMGPAFITLVQTSLHQDFKSAVQFAFGVILNDAIVIAICIFTSVQLGVSFNSGVPWFCIGAGAILVAFGIMTFFMKARKRETRHEQRAKELMQQEPPEDRPSSLFFIGKGFALNVLNPFVWIFWFSAVAIVVGGTNNTIITIIFFLIVLSTSFALDVLKAWGAAKLKRFFDADRTTLMNRVAGVLLVICGLYFIVYKGIINLV